MKSFEIQTVGDMVKCTNQNNLESFIRDLKAIIISAHTLRDLGNIKQQDITLDSYTWIDDNKKEIKIILKEENVK